MQPTHLDMGQGVEKGAGESRHAPGNEKRETRMQTRAARASCAAYIVHSDYGCGKVTDLRKLTNHQQDLALGFSQIILLSLPIYLDWSLAVTSVEQTIMAAISSVVVSGARV